MPSLIPVVLVTQQDGTISAQNEPALRLLGAKQGSFCWDAIGGIERAKGLPCRRGCVSALLRAGINQSVHTRVTIEGQQHLLSCVPSNGTVVCMLKHTTGRQAESWQSLTVRECEVLELIAAGETTASAAEILELSESTIRTHVENMLNKLDANNRPALVATGFQLGYLA